MTAAASESKPPPVPSPPPPSSSPPEASPSPRWAPPPSATTSPANSITPSCKPAPASSRSSSTHEIKPIGATLPASLPKSSRPPRPHRALEAQNLLTPPSERRCSLPTAASAAPPSCKSPPSGVPANPSNSISHHPSRPRPGSTHLSIFTPLTQPNARRDISSAAQALRTFVPGRMADRWRALHARANPAHAQQRNLANTVLAEMERQLHAWRITPCRHRRLRQSRSHHRRRRHQLARRPHHAKPQTPRPLLHRRSRRRYRLARWLQLPMGLGLRLQRRPIRLNALSISICARLNHSWSLI